MADFREAPEDVDGFFHRIETPLGELGFLAAPG